MRNIARVMIFTLDLALVSLNFFLIYFLLQHFHLFYAWDIFSARRLIAVPQPWPLYVDVFWTAFAIWSLLLLFRGGCRYLRVQTYGMVIRYFLISGVMFLFLFTGASFLLKFTFLSRVFILVYTLSSTVWLILDRVFVLYLMKKARKKGHNARHILLAGTGRRAQEFMSHMAKHTEWGYRLIGLLDRDASMLGQTVACYPVIGMLDDLPVILEKEVVDEVVFVTPRDWLDDVRKCVLYCEAVGMPATISTDLFDLEIASGSPKQLEGKSYLTFETRFPKGGELFIKRTFDIFASAIILLLSSPMLVAIALAVKLTSAGPVFFSQIRSGRNGRKFRLYKFRTMVPDAEKKMAELRASNEMSGPVFKMTNDPRITKIGKFLRKTSLDEFPQFLNVLKGDMSIVGPRPPLPSEVEEYESWQRRRLSMKPGITCIWQIAEARNSIGFEEWMEMDLRYIDNWSLLLDARILLMTVRAVVGASGK